MLILARPPTGTQSWRRGGQSAKCVLRKSFMGRLTSVSSPSRGPSKDGRVTREHGREAGLMAVAMNKRGHNVMIPPIPVLLSLIFSRDSKEIRPSVLKEINPEYSVEGLMLKLKL